MKTRYYERLYKFKFRLIVAATLLHTVGGSLASGSHREKEAPSGSAIIGNHGTTSGLPSIQLAAGAKPEFTWPASVSAANRRFLDRNGDVYLLKAMSSWAMAQNCTNAEITSALEGLKALGFNAVTVSPFGVHMNDSFGDRYKNKAGLRFFTGAPYASSLGPAWSSMDWIMAESTRLRLTVVFSLFMSWGNTGTAPDLAMRRDDECLQLWKNGGNPLCRISEHRLACDGRFSVVVQSRSREGPRRYFPWHQRHRRNDTSSDYCRAG